MKEEEKYDKAKSHANPSAEELKELQQQLKKLSEENRLLKKLLSSGKSQPSSAGKQITDFQDIAEIFPQTEFHKAFFNQIPFLMWAKDINGKYLAINSTFARLFGMDSQKIKGLTDYDVCPRVFADKYRADDARVIQTAQQIIVEELIPLESGFQWHETIKIPLKDDNGQIFGVAGFAKDITERKNFEYAIRESEEKFRELAENTTDSFILRSGKKLIYVNPAFEQIYGYSKEELQKNPELYMTCIHPDDRNRIDDILKSPMYKSTYIFNEQYRIIRGDGIISWIWNRSYPVWNNKGEVYRIVSVATNITEIKDLEDRLRKSRFQQQAILDNIPHLAWLKDNQGNYVSANQSFCRHFNIEPQDVPGKTDYDFCPPELADDFMRKDKEVLSQRKSLLFYEVEDTPFGKRYSETHKTPVINEDGEVIGITGISRDITEQKLAEQALLRSEEKFKDIVTLLPEVVFETDARGIISFANLRGFELMEYSRHDFDRGISIYDLIEPSDIPRVKEALNRMKSGSELKGMEYTVITRKGRKIPVMVFTNNIYQDGRWSGIRGVMVDITKRKRAESQERDYQSKLLFLSNTALDFLGMSTSDSIYEYIGNKLHEFIKDSEIIISSFNEEQKTLDLEYFSFSVETAAHLDALLENSQEGFSVPLPDEALENLKQNADHLVNFREGFFDTAFGFISRQVGLEMEKLLQARKLYGMALTKSGVLFGSVLIVVKNEELQDQSFIETFIYQASIAMHRRQLEMQLLEAKNQAEQSDQLKTAFLANMSHEIRTPMNGILGLAQLLNKEEVSEEDKKDYLKMINTNGNLLLNLVNDIIDISKIESNQVDLNEREFSLNELLEELKSFLASEKMVKNKGHIGIKITKSFPDDESFLLADQPKIKQIFTNLLGNSLKFTQKGEVSFGYENLPGNEILFFVKDTGIGIPEDKIKVIFDRFIQGDQSLTRPYGGSGLGLAICKGFAGRMGGEIWVESGEKEGSSFFFRIPVKRIPAKDVKSKEEKKEMKSFDWKNLSILVVEDNYVSYKLLEASLGKTGVNIIHAVDGQEAIDKVVSHPEIDLVLMDIQLPVLNGYDSTRAIKQIRPDLPVIAQTANAMDDDRLKCLNAGCSDYITKPIVLEKLLVIVNEFIYKDN